MQGATNVAMGPRCVKRTERLVLARCFNRPDVSTERTIKQWTFKLVAVQGMESTVKLDRIIGCPDAEGPDYPKGQLCQRVAPFRLRSRPLGCQPLHAQAKHPGSAANKALEPSALLRSRVPRLSAGR